MSTGVAPLEEDFTEGIPRVPAGTQLPPLAIEHKLKNVVTKTIEFEAKHRECVRVLPYSDGGHAKVHFYVLSQFYSGKSGVPQKLKAAAQKCFGDMEVELQWFDLYNDVTKILKAPPVEFSSGKPKRLNESQVYDINETIKRNLHVLVGHHNITAVQASFKITKSQQTTQPCIAIYVLRKGLIPDGEFPLPLRLGSYPVDVVDGFWLRVSQDGPWTPNKAQKQSKVLKLGASIGVQGIEASGSLGAIVEADGNFYALSCDHVMKDPLESKIIHPALNDHLNYLNYHLQEYGKRITQILKRESVSDLETHFLFDILRTESELLEKFQELKSMKENHRDPERAKEKKLKNLEIHEKALEKGFREPRVIGRYVAGVSRNVRWTNGQEYYIDVAIAQLTSDEVNKLRDSETVEVIGTGDIPSGECSERVQAQGELCKSGRTTGYTRSGRHEDPSIFAKSPLYEVSAQNRQLMDVLRRVKLCHSCTMRSGVSERLTPSGSFCDSCTVDTRTLSERLWMKNCLCVDRPGDIFREGQAFSAEGDSGAVLFEKVPKKDLLGFGIIFGEFVSPVQVYTLASPLRVALEVLSRELYDNANLRVLSNYND